MSGTTPLAALLAQRIRQTGPIPIADYMAEALGHPRHGYYRTGRPLGRDGDFTTAPEISQVFGELVGAWLAERWIAIGRPDPCLLVELGPGRATLLADALRATRGVPGFRAALRPHLVEIGQALRLAQAEVLQGAAGLAAPVWHARLDDVPEGPLLLVANEFFDALPVRQLQMTPAGWAERMVGIDPVTEELRIALAPGRSPFAALLPAGLRGAAPPIGTLAEISPSGAALMRQIAERIARGRGAALVVDYGRAESAFGASLQAVQRHRKVDVLHEPGRSDLTAHVDFADLAHTARGAGAAVAGPATQGAFLRALGIEARTAALSRAAPERAAGIAEAARRLIDPAQMGSLFLALAVFDAASAPPAGFA